MTTRTSLGTGLALAAALIAPIVLAQQFGQDPIAADAERRAALIGMNTPEAPWGCKVLLCLANPDGPTAIPQCIDPIDHLRDSLRRGHPFPECPMAQGPDGGAYASAGSNHYDRCPPGTSALGLGQQAISATVESVALDETSANAMPPPTTSSPRTATVITPQGGAATMAVYAGIGSGEGVGFAAESGELPTKVCVGLMTGEASASDSDSVETVPVFDRLVLLSPNATPSYIDVMVDDGRGAGYMLWKRVRL